MLHSCEEEQFQAGGLKTSIQRMSMLLVATNTISTVMTVLFSIWLIVLEPSSDLLSVVFFPAFVVALGLAWCHCSRMLPPGKRKLSMFELGIRRSSSQREGALVHS